MEKIKIASGRRDLFNLMKGIVEMATDVSKEEREEALRESFGETLEMWLRYDSITDNWEDFKKAFNDLWNLRNVFPELTTLLEQIATELETKNQ